MPLLEFNIPKETACFEGYLQEIDIYFQYIRKIFTSQKGLVIMDLSSYTSRNERARGKVKEAEKRCRVCGMVLDRDSVPDSSFFYQNFCSFECREEYMNRE